MQESNIDSAPHFHMDKQLEMVSVDPSVVGTTFILKNQGVDATSIGYHLLELGRRHQLIILWFCKVARLGRVRMFPTWRR